MDREHDLESTMNTTGIDISDHNTTLVVHTRLQNSHQTNPVWTDVMTDRQFGQFRFGIGLGPDLSSDANEMTSSFLRMRGTQKLFVTVTAETNRSDVRLVITSCKIVSKKNKVKSYFIQNGCLDNRMGENILQEDNKMVFILHLPGVDSMVFLSCEVKLCLTSNHSQSCPSSCPLQLLSNQYPENALETRTYHVVANPIYIIQETRKRATTNYAAIVIGMVLGITVLAVVILLVRKSFSGVRRRNLLMDL
ncbi:hypothetical protein GDO81_016263 [Engystomops pustulosus]|uniref:ZP-C domain-containing protein n=1 Tax=Engystomops pustulosus TaxID=76066 RepID=A0AAV7AX91_ENGPU|nr:hypothetical protein GDO81_016263 [Engystomops pustulosus]